MPATGHRVLTVRHPVRLGLLVCGALATSLLVFLRPTADSPDRDRPRPGLGYYLRDATLTGTGEDGRILYAVRAAAAEQVLADGTVTMTDVEVDYSPGEQVPWRLRADGGQIPPDRTIIVLAGDVVATTATVAGASVVPAPLTIRTDYLELDPEAYIASTERVVAVERNRDTLHSRGMRVYLKQDRLEFTSEVRGRFLP